MDVSVLTATLNALPGLIATYDSIAAQTGVTVEHVVADGASTDGTVPWLEGRRGVVWDSAADDGIAAALNRALGRSRGRYLLVLGAGDALAHPGALAEALSRPADLISGDVLIPQGGGERLFRSAGFGAKFHFKQCVPHQGLLARREVFAQVGGFDPTYRVALDYDWLMRARNAGAGLRRTGRPLAVMPADGVSSRRDWPALKARFAEELRVHRTRGRGWMGPVYGVYWPLYLTYRRARAAVGA